MSQATELIARQMAAGSANARVWADILYNVKLYGAKGDWNGTTGTDDTAAIQATIDAAIAAGGKAVFFPHGTYKVTALTGLSSVVLFGDNASFVGISTTINQIGSPVSNLAINVKDIGAKGDGLTNDAAAIQSAITAATTNGGIIYFPPGTYKISAALTVPSNVTLWFANGAKLSIDTGITVTINGPIDAGLYQIFSGLGLVRGNILNDSIYPQWWGAIANQAGDNQPTIQAAVDYIQASGSTGGGKLVFPNGSYTTFSEILIRHGGIYGGIIIEGNNSAINYFGTGNAIRIDPVVLVANAGDGSAVRHWELRNFQINAQTSNSATIGIKIGKTGYALDNFQWSLIENVICIGFGQGLELTEAKHIEFRRFVVRGPITRAVMLQTIANNFCGDLHFFDCEFLSGSDCSLKLLANGTTTSSELRGIHFNDCTIYGISTATRTVYIQSQGSGRIYDVWFSSCALDQGNNYAFQVSKEGSSTMGSINIHNCYAAAFTQFLALAGTNAINGYFHIKDCMVGLCALPFTIYEISNVIIQGCSFENVTTQSSVNGVTSVKNITISGNTFSGTALLASQCVSMTAAVKSAVVTNNLGNFATASTFLQDTTGLPATKMVNTGNIQLEV